MSVSLAVAVGILMGIVFGFALEKSRVFEPGIIVGQMQLRNFIMLKVFLAAVATGAVVLAVLNGFGYVKLAPKAALYGADIVGGLILGAGISLAGACPGTTLAQIGAGYRDALFTLIGGLSGPSLILCRAGAEQDLPRPGRRQNHFQRSCRYSLLDRRADSGRRHRRHSRRAGIVATVAAGIGPRPRRRHRARGIAQEAKCCPRGITRRVS